MTGSAELLMLPYEASTSYLRGAGLGPEDVRTRLPGRYPVVTVPMADDGPEGYFRRTREAVAGILSRRRKAAAVGGEHTVTYGVVAGYLDAGISPAIIQFDAHADLRESYEGTPWSHACVMRRLIEDFGLPSWAVGIRSLSLEEADFVQKRGLPVAFAYALNSGHAALPPETGPWRDIYLTLDIDAFDPSVAPGTGTPEPGGLGWYQGLDLIDAVLKGRNLVGFDVVEYSPVAERGVTGPAAAALVSYLAEKL